MRGKIREKKLRIVIFVSYTYPYVGSGIGNVALMQAENLAELGHEVILVSSNIPKTKGKFRRNGVLHFKLKATDFLERFHLPVPLFLINSKVASYIKNADVVHAHGMLYPSSLQAALLAKIFGKPFVLTQHAGYIKYPSTLINLLERLVRATMGKIILRFSKRVIVVNEEVRGWLGIDNNKVITLINGVDTSLFHPVNPRRKKAIRVRDGLPLNRKIVLFVGRLVPKKGFIQLFEARDSFYVIIFVGKGEVPTYMKKDQKKAFFLGEIPQEKLSEIYQASDLFVLPSDCEGFPLSIQEAMASGLPVITSKLPGFDKYLDKRYVEFVNSNPKEIKKAIINVLRNKPLMEKMSRYSRDVVITKISWRRNVEVLLDIYREVL